MPCTSSQALDYCRENEDDTHDIFEIGWILRQKLDTALVPDVVEYARLYRQQVTTVNRYMVVRNTNSPATCLLSNPIKSKARSRRPVRSITFDVVAKDQGYAVWPAVVSSTWFTASIVRTGDAREVLEEREIMRNGMIDKGFVKHSICWSEQSDNLSEIAWVQSLMANDQVLVRGYAEHAGSMNYINCVRVTVCTAVIVR